MEFIKETYLYLLTQGQKHRVCKAGFHQHVVIIITVKFSTAIR